MAGGWPRKFGIANSYPYEPAMGNTTTSPTRIRSTVMSLASVSSGVHSSPTTVNERVLHLGPLERVRPVVDRDDRERVEDVPRRRQLEVVDAAAEDGERRPVGSA